MSLGTNKKVITEWLISQEELDKLNADKVQKTSEEQAKDGNNTTRQGYWFSRASKNGDLCVINITGALYTEDYKYLAALIEQCEIDNDIKNIVLDISSPGGAVPGLFDFCETLRACDKDVYAYTGSSLASAAYAIGVSTKKIYATRGAMIGSVGALITLADYSEMYKKMGIKYETITSKHAENKVIDTSTKEGKAVLQERVDYAEQMFVEHIALCRDITTDDVYSKFGHGSMFYGEVAKEKGMVDAIVKNFDECISNIKESTQNIGGEESIMSLDELKEKDPKAYDALLEQAKVDAKADAEATIRASVQKEERERITAIDSFTKLSAIDGVAEVLAKAKSDGTSVTETKALAFDAILANYKEPKAKEEVEKDPVAKANAETLQALATETAVDTPNVPETAAAALNGGNDEISAIEKEANEIAASIIEQKKLEV